MASKDVALGIVETGRRLLARFAPEVAEQRKLLVLSLVALLAQALLRILEPWPLGLVIDHVLGGRRDESRPGVAWLPLDPDELLIAAALAVLAIALLRAFAGYSSTVGFSLAGTRVLTSVRATLFRHLQSLSLAFHSRARSGDHVMRVISDVGTVRDVTITALLPLVANLLVLLGMLAVMAGMNWRLTATALVTVPLFWLSMVRLGRRIQAVSRKQRRQEGRLASTAAESLIGIETVQALSLGKQFAESFARENDGSLREGVRAKRLSARLERTVDALAALSTSLVLYFGARAAMRGEIRPGELVVFLSYLKTSIGPVRDMAKYTSRLAKASASAERVLDVLDQVPDVRDREGAIAAPILRGEIQFDRATFSYDRGAAVLSDVDILIPAGSHVALVGSSGAGKSTLLSAVLRLLDPVSGSVRIDGHDLRDLTIESLRRQITVVPQQTLLFSGTVAENLAFGRPGASGEEIEAAARAAGAHDFVSALPGGYSESIGERGADLSVGQRRRLSIARANLSRAPIVILDEPLASLDPENQRRVAEALERSIAGRTTLHATHDLDEARRADLVLVIEGGRIAEFGTPMELADRDGVFASWIRDDERSLEHAVAGAGRAVAG